MRIEWINQLLNGRFSCLFWALSIYLTLGFATPSAKASEVHSLPSPAQSCRDVFGSTPASVGEIIAFADKHFERRGWSSEFLSERILLAENFPESEYYYTQSSGEITGSLAVSYAELSPELLMEFQMPGLPMEVSLKTFVGRPTGLNGKSLVTELRTYAIQREFHNSVKSSLFFAALSSVVRKYKRSYPELMDRPVIFTYGDEVSLKLYGAMGFENQTEKNGDRPIKHAGADWWVMSITPNGLQRLIEKEYALYRRRSSGKENIVVLPDGREVSVTAEVGSNDLRFITRETEVMDRLWAAAGSDVVLSKDGRVVEVSRLSRVYFDRGTQASASPNSQIQFFSDSGRLHVIESVAEPFEIAPGTWVRQGERVEWLPDGRYFKIGKRFYNPDLNHPRCFNGHQRSLVPTAQELDESSTVIFRRNRSNHGSAQPIHRVEKLNRE